MLPGNPVRGYEAAMTGKHYTSDPTHARESGESGSVRVACGTLSFRAWPSVMPVTKNDPARVRSAQGWNFEIVARVVAL